MLVKRFVCFLTVCTVLSFLDLLAQSLQPYWVTGVRDTLPTWISMPQNSGMLIAASDPCMTLENGRKQAVQRALWLYALQNKMRVRVVTDVFSKSDLSDYGVESNSDKILSLMCLDHSPRSFGYKVINEHQTHFGEVILQLQVEPYDATAGFDGEIISFNSSSEWLVVYTDDKFKRKEYKIQIRIPFEEGHADCFEVKGTWEHPVITSSFMGEQYSLSQKGCWYQDTSADTACKNDGWGLKYSFWVAYISALADQLFAASLAKYEVQSVSDSYQNNLMYDLAREKSVGYVRIVPEIKGVKDNRLIVYWDINPDEEKK